MGKQFTWLPGLKKSSLHAKSMILDKETMLVGSMNLDQMSLKINNEIGILFRNMKIAGQSAQAFDEHIESVAFRLQLHRDKDGAESIRWHLKKDGSEVVYEKEPYVGFWKKFGVRIVRMLPVEKFL